MSTTCWSSQTARDSKCCSRCGPLGARLPRLDRVSQPVMIAAAVPPMRPVWSHRLTCTDSCTVTNWRGRNLASTSRRRASSAASHSWAIMRPVGTPSWQRKVGAT
jgi:hypothetical protein